MFWEKLTRLVPDVYGLGWLRNWALHRAIEQKFYMDCVGECMALRAHAERPDSERKEGCC